MLKIGNIVLDMPFLQAAIAGYSDLAMRQLARRFGAPLTFSGVMIDTSAAHPVVARKLGFTAKNDDHPIGGQIVGTDPQTMARAAVRLVEMGYDLVDLNFACPAPKVLRRGRGGSMLNDPDTVIEIYRRVRDVVQVPVTMKLRIGFDETLTGSEEFWKIIDTVAGESINAVIIHGRTVGQYYRGRANWAVIAEVKKRFPQLTVFGSGDIYTPEDIISRLKETGIDGIAVARGAFGNPWIFSQTRAMLEGKEKPAPPTIAEQSDIIRWHFEAVAKLHGLPKAVGYFRKFSAHYCRHHPDKKLLHRELMIADTADQVRQAIQNWYS